MTAFEFVFPLFGLLVGLSYTEMLSGLARVIKSPAHERLGWLTPSLGVLILINLTMFWYGSWQLRNGTEPSSLSLLIILTVGGLYFLAASLVFPNAGDSVDDLDTHFLSVRHKAIGGIIICNLIGLSVVAHSRDWRVDPVWLLVNGVFLLLLLTSAAASSRKLVLGSMLLCIALHGVGIIVGR